MVVERVERRIPKSAIKPLMEHCKKLGEETGRPAAQIFKKYLKLMKKYENFFFSKPWPEKADKQFEFSDQDVEFLAESKNYKDESECFTLVCLRKNMSMEGFDSQGFTEDFECHGSEKCWGCSVWVSIPGFLAC
jgi:hypothetical protein